MNKAIIEKCPKCGSNLLMFYGWGFDYDRLICGSKYCPYEIELTGTTIPNDQEDKENVKTS